MSTGMRSSLPSYSVQAPAVEVPRQREYPSHVFSLSDSARNTPWLVLTFKSRAKSAESTPLFYEGATVPVSIKMTGPKVKNIRDIVLQIKGSVGTGDSKDVEFLDHNVSVWSSRLEVPRIQSSNPSTSASTLEGTCLWDFTVSLPLQGRVKGQPCCLPQSMSERTVPVSVRYWITVSSHRLTSSFNYLPSAVTPQLTPLHQAAYERNMMLPGPIDNPEGWVSASLLPCSIEGNFKNQRITRIEVHLQTTNCSHFSHLPNLIDVRLIRKVSYYIWPSPAYLQVSKYEIGPSNSRPLYVYPVVIVSRVTPGQAKPHSLGPPAYESSQLPETEEQARREYAESTYNSGTTALWNSLQN
ncbi:hypothetical protein DL96DRAFT_1578098 [Flagelloscypha sp. PMI_526]|nr:hypothetical protein DL96DRAFT_1578098 [Flagelloscypha sp. PMI_526]